MEASDAEYAANRLRREGYRSLDYTGKPCKKCQRNRVMNCRNGMHVCEKCGWDNDRDEYTDYLQP